MDWAFQRVRGAASSFRICVSIHSSYGRRIDFFVLVCKDHGTRSLYEL